MDERSVLKMMDTMLDLRAEVQKQLERERILERLLKCEPNGYISIKQLCAIFDIDLPEQTEEAQAEEQE